MESWVHKNVAFVNVVSFKIHEYTVGSSCEEGRVRRAILDEPSELFGGRPTNMLAAIMRGRPNSAAASPHWNSIGRSVQLILGVEGAAFVGLPSSPLCRSIRPCSSYRPELRAQPRTSLSRELLGRRQDDSYRALAIYMPKFSGRERGLSTSSQGGDSGNSSSQYSSSDSAGRSRGSTSREQSGSRSGGFQHQRRVNEGSSSGFIRMVLSQVKDDLEKNPELRKAVDDLKASAFSQKTQSMSSRIHGLAALAAKKALAAAEATQSQTGRVLRHFRGVEKTLRTAQAELLRQASRYETCRALGRHTQKAKLSAAAAAAALQAVAAKAASVFQEEPEAQKKVAQWRQRMAIQRYNGQQRQATTAGTNGKQSGEATAPPSQEQGFEFGKEPQETALVISHETAWDRFGSKLRDMPFLQSFYGPTTLFPA